MDPFLEAWWRDVHHKLCTYACDAIQAQLGGGLRARIDERLVVEGPEGPERTIYPDLSIIESDGGVATAVRPATGAAVADSLLVRIAPEPVRQAFLSIIDVRNGNRLITAIEFHWPSNKLPGDGREQYLLRKQSETRHARASLVEIDLVRAGERVTLAERYLPTTTRSTYQVCIYRPWQRDVCQVIRIPLDARLPVIPIPLRQGEAEAALDLQAVLDQAYRNGAYGEELEYDGPCTPPLEGADAELARALLARRA
jgi:hypothetical protein